MKADAVPDNNTDAIKICLLDTGYDLDHPDLPKGEDAVTGTSEVGDSSSSWNTDPISHGTHVAGIIAAIGGNDIGVKGVISNGNVKLHISKVFDDTGRSSISAVLAGYQSCVANGAKVINISLGSKRYSKAFQTLITSAYNNDGVITVAAAGNYRGNKDGEMIYAYPASFDHVLSVGSVDSANHLSHLTTYNDKIDLVAPGTDILSTISGGVYGIGSGTSLASPHVAGVAALVWSTKPSLTNQEVMDILVDSATDLGDPGYDIFYGHGLVNAEEAYNLAQNSHLSLPPTAAPTPADQEVLHCETHSSDISVCSSFDGCFWYPAKSKCFPCTSITVEENCIVVQSCTWTGGVCE